MAKPNPKDERHALQHLVENQEAHPISLDEAILYMRKIISAERWHGRAVFVFKDGAFTLFETERTYPGDRKREPED